MKLSTNKNLMFCLLQSYCNNGWKMLVLYKTWWSWRTLCYKSCCDWTKLQMLYKQSYQEPVVSSVIPSVEVFETASSWRPLNWNPTIGRHNRNLQSPDEILYKKLVIYGNHGDAFNYNSWNNNKRKFLPEIWISSTHQIHLEIVIKKRRCSFS